MPIALIDREGNQMQITSSDQALVALDAAREAQGL